jgi:hypothetical protein
MRRPIAGFSFGLLFAVILFAGISAGPLKAQSGTPPGRWLHVRVDSNEAGGETVRVNVPVEFAEKVLASVDHDRLHHGRISLGASELNGFDLRAMLDAVRTVHDGEFVTVNSRDENVRVAKQDGLLLIHAVDKHSGKSGENVEVRVPMNVVEALVAPGNQELDLVRAIHALASVGDTELVDVKDANNTVRVWLDSKNSSD